MRKGRLYKIAEFLKENEKSKGNKDILVEGEEDKIIIKWFLSQNKIKNVVVRTISPSIIVDSEILSKYDLATGERNRLIAFANEIEGLTNDGHKILCLIDSDFDHILGIIYELKHLLSTNYSCIESFFFNENLINKFLTLSINYEEESATDILNKLASPIKELFLRRLINHLMNLNINFKYKLPQLNDLFNKKIKIEKFNTECWKQKYLRKKTSMSRSIHLSKAEEAEFNKKLSNYSSHLTKDCRFAMNGHDFIKLLTCYIKETSNKLYEYSNESKVKFVRTHLRTSLENNDLLKENFFNEILKFAKS